MTTHTYDIHRHLRVDHEPLGVKDAVAYRAVLSETGKPDEVWEGTCPLGNLPTPDCLHPWGSRLGSDSTDHRQHGTWAFITPEGLDELALWGWRGTDGDHEWTAHVSTLPYTDLPDDTLILVRLYEGGHMVFDRHGQALPVAHYVDYCGWSTTDRDYDLEAAMTILAGRVDVHDLSRGRIPYYNRDGGRKYELSFRWTPDTETYRAVWAKCLELGDFPTTSTSRAVAALDTLGIEGTRRPPQPFEYPDDEGGDFD